MAASTNPGGLYSVIFLAPQAQVMLTVNLWQEAGLCNGAAGTVHQLLFAEGQAPPYLPIAVLVDFVNYNGLPFFNDRPNCLPIPPILSEWNSAGKHLSQQQLPLKLRYAITIHKSQGQTLEKAVIDIGSAELAAGCTFFAIGYGSSKMVFLNRCHLNDCRQLQKELTYNQGSKKKHGYAN